MVSADILMVSSILFQDICKNRESGSTFSGGVGLCREREVAGRNSVGTAWRQAQALGLLGAYLDIASDLCEHQHLYGFEHPIRGYLRSGEWQHVLGWYMAVPGGRRRGGTAWAQRGDKLRRWGCWGRTR